MSKARVHFFLGILGMLPRFNFLEVRIFFWKDLPVLGGGGASGFCELLCRLENYIQREEARSSYFSYVSNFLFCFFTNERVLYTCEGYIWRAFLLFALSWPTSHADVKCERPSIWNLLLYQKKAKNSTSALLKGVDSAQTVTRKSKGTQPNLLPICFQIRTWRSTVHPCARPCAP